MLRKSCESASEAFPQTPRHVYWAADAATGMRRELEGSGAALPRGRAKRQEQSLACMWEELRCEILRNSWRTDRGCFFLCRRFPFLSGAPERDPLLSFPLIKQKEKGAKLPSPSTTRRVCFPPSSVSYPTSCTLSRDGLWEMSSELLVPNFSFAS